jgi:hypothetical protein
MPAYKLIVVVFVALSIVPSVHAGATLLLAEPYGGFGLLSPTGHAATYLDRICAVSSVELRRCHSGEFGVVISRYQHVAGYDWIAIPLIPFLYAVDSSADVPAFANKQTVALLRDEYRRRHLRDLAPDTATGRIPGGGWTQLIGAAYDRKIFAFEIETSEVQDDEFIKEFNSRKNKSHFNLFYRNCADLTRNMINFYYPKSLRRSLIADLGITTPKQLAKSLVGYSKKHPELQFSAYIIPQIPGNRPKSHKARGISEGLVKTTMYAAPLVVLNIWIAPTLVAGYVATGRFNPAQYAATVYLPAELEARALLSAAPHPSQNGSTVNGEAEMVGHISPNSELHESR